MARTTYRATWAAPDHGGALTPSRMAHMVTVTGNSLVLFALQLVDQVTCAFIILVAQSFPEMTSVTSAPARSASTKTAPRRQPSRAGGLCVGLWDGCRW